MWISLHSQMKQLWFKSYLLSRKSRWQLEVSFTVEILFSVKNQFTVINPSDVVLIEGILVAIAIF